jgi:hypothetical protein
MDFKSNVGRLLRPKPETHVTNRLHHNRTQIPLNWFAFIVGPIHNEELIELMAFVYTYLFLPTVLIWAT